MQQEEDIQHLSKVQSERSAQYLSPRASPKRRWRPVGIQEGYSDGKEAMSLGHSTPPPTPPRPLPAPESGKGLQEIMDEELALQLSKDAEVSAVLKKRRGGAWVLTIPSRPLGLSLKMT